MNKAIYTTRYIPVALEYEQALRDELLAWIGSIKGVKAVNYNGAKHKVSVEYDLMVLNFEQLLLMLTEKGVGIRRGIMFSLLSSWLNYIDKTAKSNASAPPPSCCNKPPPRARR